MWYQIMKDKYNPLSHSDPTVFSGRVKVQFLPFWVDRLWLVPLLVFFLQFISKSNTKTGAMKIIELTKVCHHHHPRTFGVWGSVSGENVGVIQFSDVVQADAEANIVDHLRRWERVTVQNYSTIITHRGKNITNSLFLPLNKMLCLNTNHIRTPHIFIF